MGDTISSILLTYSGTPTSQRTPVMSGREFTIKECGPVPLTKEQWDSIMRGRKGCDQPHEVKDPHRISVGIYEWVTLSLNIIHSISAVPLLLIASECRYIQLYIESHFVEESL